MAFALLALAAFPSCNKEVTEENHSQSSKADQRLKGVWKVKSSRLNGGNVSSVNILNGLVADPGNDYIFLAFKEGQSDTDRVFIQEMRMVADETTISVINGESFESYLEKRDENLKDQLFTYQIEPDGNTMRMTAPASAFISPELLIDEPGGDILMELHRDVDLERSISESSDTKFTIYIPDWMKQAVKDLIRDYVPNCLRSPDRQPYVVKYPKWKNSGWEPGSWMSLLPGDRPVCCVNIPGTHDSATSTANMGFVSTTVNADCQSLSIEEQYDAGARYFDFRVGQDFVWDLFPVRKRVPTKEDMDKLKDMYMFHGPASTGIKYKESLETIAKKVRSGDMTEFVFINTQWEDFSYGVLDIGEIKVNEIIHGEKAVDQILDAMRYASMELADRLQREVNAEYNGDLFINYSSDLTVSKARGHIILIEAFRDLASAVENPQCTYEFDWPDDKVGYAHISTYSDANVNRRLENPQNVISNGKGYNARIQSMYTVHPEDLVKTAKKEKAIKDIAQEVTRWNMEDNKRILGYNAMNANTGEKTGLWVKYLANMFNASAFETYVENMKNSSIEKRFRSGIVPMDYLGADKYSDSDINVYGDLLRWAVIESNFYQP